MNAKSVLHPNLVLTAFLPRLPAAARPLNTRPRRGVIPPLIFKRISTTTSRCKPHTPPRLVIVLYCFPATSSMPPISMGRPAAGPSSTRPRRGRSKNVDTPSLSEGLYCSTLVIFCIHTVSLPEWSELVLTPFLHGPASRCPLKNTATSRSKFCLSVFCLS